MINSKKIENIYDSFINNEIDVSEAKNQLIITIIKNPQFYGLEKLNKECLHEIIETIIYKMDSIFNNYDETKNTKFSTYFQTTIRFMYQSWKKKYFSDKIKNTIIQNFNTNEIYEKEKENIYSPEKSCDSMINDTNISIHYSGKDTKYYERKEPCLEFLIIALKSSYYISENQITEISKLSKINRNKLTELIDNLNKKLTTRKINKTSLQERINKDFFKLQETKIKILLNKNNSIEKEILEKQLNRIKKRRNQNIIKFNKMKLVPSDKDIGEILNLSPSKVRYYLRKNYRIYNIKQKKVAKEKISAK